MGDAQSGSVSSTGKAILPRRQPRMKQRTREAIEGYLFVAPAVIGFFIFTFFPMIASFALSLTEYNLLSSPKWIGWDNFVEMANDDFFWKSLRITTTYAVVALPLGMAFALLVALLL